MTKLRKFLKVGLPIIATSAVGAGAITAIALSAKHTSTIDKNLYQTIEEYEESGIVQELTWDLPSIANGWGRIALMPVYSDTVIEKFGAVYEPDKNNVKWPRLIANSVSAEDARIGRNVSKDDLITFEQLIPNETLAQFIANGICRVPSTSTVLEWKDDDVAPNGGFWINHLAQFDGNWDIDEESPRWDWTPASDPEKKPNDKFWHVKCDYISEFVGSSIFAISSKYTGDQSKTTNVDRLLASVLMNPFMYDFDAYGYTDKSKSEYFMFEPAWNHVFKWWLDNNELTTLPRGLFQHVYLYDTDPDKGYIKEKPTTEETGDGVIIDFENNNIANLNPLQLFGSRVQPEWGEIESWESRQAFGPGIACDLYLDIGKTLINYYQDSWQKYAGNLYRNGFKYGWNLSNDEGNDLYTWVYDSDAGKKYKKVGYLDNVTPDVGPLPRYNDMPQPWLDVRNYGVCTTTDRISDTVMYTLTNGFKKNDIWATNLVIPIVINTNKCLAEMNWISVPLSTSFVTSGVSNDMEGLCDITIGRAGSSPLDIQISFEITGFNEATSGLILSILLTIIFILALSLSVWRVYRNYHPKLSKDELKTIHEINSANRLNKIRQLAEEKERASKEESQQ